jgi:hypothetical protein
LDEDVLETAKAYLEQNPGALHDANSLRATPRRGEGDLLCIVKLE